VGGSTGGMEKNPQSGGFSSISSSCERANRGPGGEELALPQYLRIHPWCDRSGRVYKLELSRLWVAGKGSAAVSRGVFTVLTWVSISDPSAHGVWSPLFTPKGI
jgi:hypothetical protein